MKVDLTNCDREPIHIPGAIQPHGILFSLTEPDLAIDEVTANTVAIFGVPPEALLEHPLAEVLDDVSHASVVASLPTSNPREISPLKLRTRAAFGGGAFDGILHRSGKHVVLELEPATSIDEVSFSDFYRSVRRAVVRLQGAEDVVPLCQVTADEVRAMTGFDRVMVYRFDADGHGHVIAEAKRAELESFLDLHYPASDIPAQARRLYALNWLRLIVDVGYRPAAIVSRATNTTREPLDLSFAVLRSVSPIHVEYLSNMGVRASMSISLMRESKLWGLIICHHYAPRFVPYEVRTACEFLGQELSWQVAARESREAADRRAAAQAGVARLLERLSGRADFGARLVDDPSAIVDLVGANGVAICSGGRWYSAGDVPAREQLGALLTWTEARFAADRVIATDRLAAEFEDAAAYASIASGLLAVAISATPGNAVLWFRGEVVQQVHWAGDPNKTATLTDGTPRLSPRGSFALWKETVRARSLPWQSWEIEAATGLGHAIRQTIAERAAELAQLNRELSAANHAKDEFLATVSHELRTPLNAMLGWLRMLRGNLLPVARRESALETVERNAKVQAQLVDDLLDVSRIIAGKLRIDVEPVDLVSVVDAALDSTRPSADAKGIRLEPVLEPRVGPIFGDASRLQQVVWNLLTNAVKFTASGGRVRVMLQRRGALAEITVTDNGEGIDPAQLSSIFERFRQEEGGSTRRHGGLGLGLAIVKHLVELHGGTVSASSAGKGHGTSFTVRLPIAQAAADDVAIAPDTTKSTQPEIECPKVLAGARILVVDDEPDSAALLVALLQHCKADVTTVDSAALALESIRKVRPHIIVSDIGMPVTDGYALMRTIRALPRDEGGHTPAVALTAYARAEDRSRAFRAGYQAHVPKPVDASELLAVLESLLVAKPD